MRRWAIFTGLLATAAACGSFSANTEPSPPDAGVEAGIKATDAAQIADAGVFSCKDHPDATSCLDFDDNPTIAPDWIAEAPATPPTIEPGGLSPPYALGAKILRDPTAALGTASRIRHAIPADAGEARVSFDVKWDPLALTDGGQITIAEFLCVLEAGVSGLVVNIGADGLAGLSTLANGFVGGTLQVPSGTWHHVVIDAHFGAGATISIDGNLGNPGPASECPIDSRVSVGLGSATDQGASALFDDILYELNPL